jgi:hypothetical protein
MLVIVFILANIAASLTLMLTMIGSIAAQKIKLDIATILSIMIGYVFIGICVALSVMHPWLFLMYAVSTAGTMLFWLRPAKEELMFASLLTVICFFFWPEMIALAIFNMLFVKPKIEDNGD